MIANEHLITKEMREKAADLMARTKANGGLAPLDVERFWHDNDLARKDPFGKDIPQMAMGLNLYNEHSIYSELGIPMDVERYQKDHAWRISMHKAFNDKAERIVGRRLFPETAIDTSLDLPARKQLNDVFEAKNVWHDQSWWMEQSANSVDELSALLDRVDARNKDLRPFLLPANWESEKKRLAALGAKPGIYRGQRGPVTFATSVFGVENLIFLILDKPELAARFRDAIITTMLNIGRIFDEEAGYTPETAPHGFWFADDNCAMLNADMYEFFGYPVLKAMFDRYSPDPGDSRYQHSDSAMAQLLPVLGRLDLTGVNFGPTLTVSEIRKYCPKAVIDGQLAPFTLSRNEEENIVLETLRDIEQSREHHGVSYNTAGSVNDGSRLTGMRLVMATIQEYGRYN